MNQKLHFIKLIKLFIIVLFPFLGFSQTTIINPATFGGFEAATTFGGANGWITTAAGGATNNQWVCNTGATAGFSGARCAYVTNNNAGSPPHTYTLGTTRATQFYRPITIPAGETNIILSFNWLNQGESTYDKMRVWIVPTTVTPVYGTALTASGVAPTGNIQVGATNYSVQGAWTSASFNLPTAYAGTTVRLVFEWTNDASGGTQPPAAIDNISLTSQIPVPPVNNECLTATSLTVNGTATCTTSTNGNSNFGTQSQAGCSGTADDDVWYTFVATNANHIVTVTPSSMTDAVFQVFSGTCAALTSIICVNNTTGTTAETTTLIGLTIGNTYRVRVHSNANGTGQGSFNICVTTPPPPPANNLCANATPLPCGTTNLAGTTVNTASIVHNSGCTMADYGVWYTFVGDGNPTTISTTPAFDIKLSISTGACGALTNVVCTDTTPETATFTSINGTTYYVYVAYWLSGGSTTGTFTISRSCVTCAPPTANAATNITFTTATVSWNPPSYTPSNGYQYAVTTSATPPGSGIATTPTTVNITALTANTVYYLHVRSDCGAVNGFSTWSTISFITGYCTSTSTSATYHIDDFSTTGGTANITNNNSNYSATGYGNFTAQTVSQQQYGTVSFSTTIVGGSSGFTIWVDWNDDFDFNDTGETVFLTGSYVTAATGSFTVPGTASVGNHRMRIRSDYFATNPSACGSITSGETEDYTFTVLTSTCPGIPTAVTSSVTSTTAATINWSASVPAPSNGYQYYLTTSATLPNTATVPTGTTAAGVTTVSLTGLTPNTTYYIYVRNNCGSGNVSPWTGQVSFFTGYCVSTSTSATYHIDNFSTTGGTANITNNNSNYSAGGYGNFTAQTVSQQQFGSVSFSAAYVGSTFGFSIWVDWNNDLDFDDSGELMYNNGTYAAANTGSFIVPAATTVGNHRMRIRANYLSTNPDECGVITGGETEDYTFNVLPPPACSANPTNITVFLNSQTAATVNWVAASPVPPNGYQYYLTTATTAPTGATAPTGSTTSAVTSVSLTGLVSGTTYYIWVRSNCGGGTGVGVWIGPTGFTMPTCTIGPGTGTTALACPDITSGGLGLSGTDPAPVVCGSGSTCVDLEATYLQIGESTDYTVSSIPFAPPYQFNCLRNPVSINIDDRWSPIITLPFDFCFYGNNYNQCLMSSNGVLTFDLVSNLPNTYSAWSFSNNLPSTNLFTNTIFGVYHDIDPLVGGQIGWELITLNTGCRALVASWHDVPMYSATCNAQLYTGMIVMYENTNVIEVYVEEKNVCGTHNAGNAILGLQNATGTSAVVAPGRNGLDTDWTTTNEAWRFTPSGTSISTVTWYEGSGTSGPVVGTSDVINVCPPTTTTYTAEIEYNLCNGTTLIETDEVTVTVSGNKIWDGSTSTNWNDNSNWTPVGVPVSTDCVVIPNVVNDPVIIGASYNGVGRSLAVNANASLNITPTNSVTISNAINVSPSATFVVQDDASIIQINNVPNVGNIQYNRNASVRRQDYVYWSTPVAGFANSAVSPGTSLGYQYKWTPTIGTNINGFGNWTYSNETMVLGKGYCLRAPDSFSATALTNYTATFTGVPNNGNIATPISRGLYNGLLYSTAVSTTPGTRDDDNWNLVGNPYPSAINAINFLTLNTNIAGFVNIWTHGTLPSAAITDPFYANYSTNYTVADYITYNALGLASGASTTYAGRIAGGQGFFVSMLHTSAAVTENLNFNNSLRSNTYNNSEFYRTTDNTIDYNNIEKHRIWFDLVTPSGTSTRALLGYAENATYEEDRMFDAFSNQKLAFNIFSLIDDEPMLIQGRKLPFDNNDKVNIGVSIPSDGLYKIALNSIDGLFLNAKQNIYLEDKLLNIFFNLKDAPYSFMTNKGTIKDRFVLRYTKNENITEIINQLTVYDNNVLTVESGKLKIKDIVVFDTLGKLLLNKNNINNTNYQINNLNKTNSMLIVKVTLEDNTEEIRKVIY